MIPINLKLSGFLSYREAVEVDFSRFHLACISGPNGAGKSSLLDALTWALFGQARKKDDSLVNLQSKAAEVSFTFSYEENIYRVRRMLSRGKTGTLEFQVLEQEGEQGGEGAPAGTWRALTESTARETQRRIESILRLDYDTFTNVSFFLQGRADQFAQQNPSRRKEILGNILGLEAWEEYKERAAERRKGLEREVDALDGRLEEIEAELKEEPERVERLRTLSAEAERAAELRKTQEAALAGMRQARQALEQQAGLVSRLEAGLERRKADLRGVEERLGTKKAERETFSDILGRAGEVEAAHAAWQASRKELERWDATAASFHEQEKHRQPFLAEIQGEKARLEQEKETLEAQKVAAGTLQQEQERLEVELAGQEARLVELENRLALGKTIEAEYNTGRERATELRTANEGLKEERIKIKAHMDQLMAVEAAVCPLCGQELSPEHRQATLEGLNAEGTRKGDAWRANKAELDELAVRLQELEKQASETDGLEAERLSLATQMAAARSKVEGLKAQAEEWERAGAKRLEEVERLLGKDEFAREARKALAKVDRELAKLGYDTGAHDAARSEEQKQRGAEEQLRDLTAARAAMGPLENEVASLEAQARALQEEIRGQQEEVDQATAELAAAQAAAPDVATAEGALYKLQEQVNQLNQEVGAAMQKVKVLDSQRERRRLLTGEREDSARLVGRYKALERAFGKDGVPALLIEQALPEIEAKANELLERLSDGTMAVRFVTQSAYKDKKREDLRETLDIQISDGAGVRDYEMYSGGEAFRVNFAIRLALSEVLASRKGARLQMLVIDEGFGSQDEQGRGRLVQAINAVQEDFAKVLVITHLDELKDAFPNRIEVEKGEGGSRVRVS